MYVCGQVAHRHTCLKTKQILLALFTYFIYLIVTVVSEYRSHPSQLWLSININVSEILSSVH